MGQFIRVANKSEIPAGKGKSFMLQGAEVGVFNDAGNFYAVGNSCPHKGGPLSDGPCVDGSVMCPWHGFRFDLKTGSNPEGMPYQVKTYKTKIEGDEIQVEMG